MFSDVDIFMCDFLKLCELNLLIQIGFLKPALFLVLFCWPPLGHFLRAGVFHLQPTGLVTIKGPWAKIAVIVVGNGHRRQHALGPLPGYWGNQSLRESPVPGLSEWHVPEETSKACVPFLLPPLPLSPGHIPVPATPLCGGCFHYRWGDPKEGGWKWEPHHQETWSPGGFSSSLEAPQPLGAVGVVSLQEDPPGSGDCGPVQRGTGTPHPWGMAHWLAYPPQLLQPQDSPSMGPKPAQASGMWQQPRSLRPEGRRESAFSFCTLYWCRVTYNVVGCVCFCFRCTCPFLGFSSHVVYYTVLNRSPYSIVGSSWLFYKESYMYVHLHLLISSAHQFPFW